MKHFYLCIILFFGIFSLSFSQERKGPVNPPPHVSEAFENDNTNGAVEEVSWWTEGEYYVVKFIKNSYSQRGFYTRKGVWKYSEIDVNHSMLKQPVFKYLDETYGQYKVKKVVLHDEPGNNFYIVKIDNAQGREKLLKFSEAGAFLGP